MSTGYSCYYMCWSDKPYLPKSEKCENASKKNHQRPPLQVPCGRTCGIIIKYNIICHEHRSIKYNEREWISQYLEYSSRWKICQLCTMSKGMLKIALNVCCCCSGVFLPALPLNKEWCKKDTWLYYRKRRHNIEFTWTSAFAGRTTVPSRGRSIICIQTDSSIYMFRMAYGTWMYLLMERAKEKLRLGNHGDNAPWNLRLCRQENILDKMIAHVAHFIKSLRS